MKFTLLIAASMLNQLAELDPEGTGLKSIVRRLVVRFLLCVLIRPKDAPIFHTVKQKCSVTQRALF